MAVLLIVYFLAKFQLHKPITFEVTALQEKIDNYRDKKSQAFNKVQ